MSDAHKGLHVGENNIMFGKNHSDETRKKISGATSGENNPMFVEQEKNIRCSVSPEPKDQEDLLNKYQLLITKLIKQLLRFYEGSCKSLKYSFSINICLFY